MEEFIQRLTNVLLQRFPDSELELEPAGARVGGFLIWDGFEAAEQIERQRQLWRVLRAELSPEDQLKIAAILTLTHGEMTTARQG
jgi:hypothetical protein